MDQEVSAAAAAADTQPVVFRGGKKRKFYRQRAGDDAVDASAENNVDIKNLVDSRVSREPSLPATQSLDPANTDTKEEEGLSVAEILRRRNTRKSRLRGVGFGNAGDDAVAGTEEDQLSLMIREEQDNAAPDNAAAQGGMTTRFMAQTGMAAELINKHMTTYIESEMAKRKAIPSQNAPTDAAVASSTSRQIAADPRPAEHEPPGQADGHISLQSKLMEVDLGDESRHRNEAMTNLATRRLQGGSIDDDDDEHSSTRANKKVRLGRDGKPWRPRNRRGSDAVKRDQLVEEFLRENKLDMYDTPSQAAVSGDTAADDRIAEEFKREFMDAMAERQKKRRPAAQSSKQGSKQGAKKDEEVLKGPKLGGSRNQRAAMRDILLKQQEAKR